MIALSCNQAGLLAWMLLLLSLSEVQSDCPRPVLPPYSSLRGGGGLEDTYPAAAVLRLQCIPGYEYIPGITPRMTCLDTSKWSDLPTLCQGKRCPVPNIENGKIVSSGDLRLGEEVTLGCNYGFRIIGGSVRRCVLKSGIVDWNRELPVCERIPCVRPPVIANGRYDPSPSDVYDVGWIAIYRCDPDYSLIGNYAITCVVAENGIDGKWDLPSPECKKVKCPRPSIPNGNVTSVYQATYTYQDNLEIECNPGYTLLGSSLIQCDADSQWKPSLSLCGKIPTTSKPTKPPTPAVPSTPPIPPKPGTVSPKEDCTEEVKCHRPRIPNGRIASVFQATYTYQNKIIIECNPGYTLLGSSLIECDADSQWKPWVPRCDKSDCPRPVLPPHSSLRGGGSLEDTYPAAAILILQCITGYEYIPGITPRMTCLDTSKWSDLPTLCQGKRCPVPNIENGKIVSSNDLRLGEEVTLGCNYGFRIIGGTTRQCVLKSGIVDWNRELPACERIPCVRPPVIANGRYDPSPSDVYDAGWIAIYRCDPDYSLIGNSEITCVVAENGVDGKWDLPSPECKKVKCPRPSIPNGNVASAYQATYTYQDNLQIECNPGYTFLGSSLIQCDADSQWKPSLSLCGKIPTTSKPTKPPTPAVPSTPPIPPRPGTLSPKEDGTEAPAGPSTTTQTTPKDEPGSGHVIGIAIGAVIAAIVLAALIYAAVRWFSLRGKANTHPASTDNYRVVSARDVALEPKSKD
ncbi:C4b-binding protein alpha chain-like [Notechis scutatus]|uniref:C4b-binding protein alpha chain-like n=1 Tax=Notechis scutatus TaxID=8663 RepID=A0A6J1UQ97_9SAUR|nr:C4b-binding protein alpha chain-like [Notechis scutatus]